MRVAALLCALPLLALSAACRDQDSIAIRLEASVTVFGADCPVRLVGANLPVPLTPTSEDVTLLTGAVQVRGEKAAIRVRFVALDKPVRLMMGGRTWDIAPESAEVPSNLGMDRVVTWLCPDAVKIAGALYRPRLRRSAKFETGAPSLVLQCDADRLAYGRVSIEGASYHFLLADSDASERFGDSGDHWRLLEDSVLSAMNKPEPMRFSPYSLMSVSDPVHLAGGRMVRFASFDGKCAEILIGKATITEEAYVADRMAKLPEAYRKKYEGVVEERLAHYGDAARPAADVPLAWRYALRPEALSALAASADKPLFVFFDTEWCLYCRLMEALTLRDKEVVAFVRAHFVPVTVHSDLYLGKLDADRGIKGFPCVLIIDQNGRETCRLDGFSPPAKYLAKWKKKWPPEASSAR